MRKNTLEAVKFALRPNEAAAALGAQALLSACIAAGWLKPVVHRHKLVLFDRGDLARCWQRLRQGESPFPPTDTIPGGIQTSKLARQKTA